MKLISEKQCNTETAISSLQLGAKKIKWDNFNETHLLNIMGNITEAIDNPKLDQVKSQRDLGLQVSENLNWNENCSFKNEKVYVLFQA